MGLGIRTSVFTHGAYLDAFTLGAPVKWKRVVIGNNVWAPNAWINPGVSIGDNVVIAAFSLVNQDIPSGSLAGGIPAKVIRENFIPTTLNADQRRSLIFRIMRDCQYRNDMTNRGFSFEWYADIDLLEITVGTQTTHFELTTKNISGEVTPESLLVKDQLRRNGIRFRFKESEGTRVKWNASDFSTLSVYQNLTQVNLED